MTSLTAIVAHDAGGAEVLSSYVRATSLPCAFALAGPALKVFERKLGAITNLSVADAIAASGRLLCGTSWQSDIEREAIVLARAEGNPSSAWLDHWVNYRARFERDGTLVLPDEIWVGDDCARAIAQRELPEVRIVQRANPYFADIREEIAAAPPLYPPLPAGQLAILYVCEPIREHALLRYGDERHFGYTEEEALRFFLRHVEALGAPVGRILVRPHPSEQAGKYDVVLREFALPVTTSHGDPLSAEVAASDVVVGCASMAMVVGLIGGKRVVSCIPPGGPACALPQPEITLLRDVVSA